MLRCSATPEAKRAAPWPLGRAYRAAVQGPEERVAAWEAEGHTLEETSAELARLSQVRLGEGPWSAWYGLVS
jgi:hypothetical protein